MSRILLSSSWLTLCLCAGVAAADDASALRFSAPETFHWQVGVVVKARGTTTGIVATATVPMSWPEQEVELIHEDVTRNAKVRFRTLDDTVKQMVVTIPRLRAGEEARAVLTYKIQKRHILAPQDPQRLLVAARVPRDLRKYLQPSPYIESDHPRIQSLAREILSDDLQGWRRVETIFDWVRDNVEYKFDEQIRGAMVALDNGRGDCEELTSLFIALCRNHDIPARAVWIPDHCYPEFYLVDAEGNGQWIPCQAAGQREFGAMTEKKPVLQKGDSFRVPGQREPQRYVAETLSARHADVNPEVTFIRRPVEIHRPGDQR